MFHLGKSRPIFRLVFLLLAFSAVIYYFFLSSRFRPFQLPFRAGTVNLGKHVYRQDGVLEVNLGGPHPIFELMRAAEDEWNRKLTASSKSLAEAVQEYRRRYHRNPPKGFNLWWDYVQQHNVQLPDEYDSIYHDLEPFWGIEPSDLQDIASELESRVQSYTLGKNSTTGTVGIVNASFTPPMTYDHLTYGTITILEVLRLVEQFLPPFRATFSPEDTPVLLTDYKIKQATLDAARSSSYISRTALPNRTENGWASACSPSSPLASAYPINLDMPYPVKPNKTFIHDHLKTMDPCLHPEMLLLHGQFLGNTTTMEPYKYTVPKPEKAMIPQFGYCSTTIHHNIRVPYPYGWIEDISAEENPKWGGREDSRLHWRGTTTGIEYAIGTRWRQSHRAHMVWETSNVTGTIDVLSSPPTDQQALGPPKTMQKSIINPALFDIAFAGPMVCSPEICEELKKVFDWHDWQGLKEAGNYSYAFDIDGNGWSGRFKRLITSNAIVFKATIYPEWHIDRIAPWLHYVPVQIDLSDLHDALVFFRGDEKGEGAHEDLARKIAAEGRRWSKTFWRHEDMAAYFLRLFLEYARLMSLDRESMSFDLHSEGPLP
ncbi:glycosyl transferase family 90-domain-containing protein [Mycena floridula]|nr:glycosyl transferase family 90-domain-containing protein [Mycena floridula]